MNFNSKRTPWGSPALSKFFLAMKLTVVLLLAVLIQVSAKTYSQNITLREKNISIKKVLVEIEKQSGYHFLYDNLDLPKADKINIEVKDATVEQALTECLKNQPVAFKIFEQTIVLRKSTEVDEAKMLKVAEIKLLKVQGTVKDEQGAPLPGVNVRVKGGTVGAITDSGGNYTIDAFDNNSVLVFTSIGFETQEIVIAGRSNINVKLTTEVKNLSDVVVVGYGTVKKKDLTGSVSIVNVDNAKKVATYDVAKMLQGQAAGVSVQSSGEPGSFVQIKVRGISSLQSNGPLFVIDGVPVDINGPFDFSPDNIETMQVLKDASSAALYGTQAAGGVVIITTKKGKAGPLKLDYSGYYGVQNINKKLSLADRVGYQKITNASQVNAGLPLFPQNDPSNPLYVSNINTDWQQELFKTGNIQDHSVNLSGGSDAITYNLGLGYFNQTSTLVGPQSYNRYSFSGSFTGKKGIFTFGGKTAYTQSNKNNLAITSNHAVFGGGVTNMLLAIPIMPVYDSKRLGGYGGSDNVISLNVIGMNDLVTDKSDRNRMLGNFWAEAEILKNLKFKTNLSFDRLDYHNYHYEPQFDLGFYYLNTTYFLFDTRGTNTTGLAENTLTYMFQAGKHKVDFLAGMTYQQDNFDFLSGSAKDSPNLNFISFSSIPNASAKGITGFPTVHTLASYLGRINYNYDNRYYITGNIRRDGSSRFGPLNKWGNFSSVGAAWNIANEKVIKLPSVISTLKLRGGYGILGNERFPDYKYQSYVNGNAAYLFDTPSTKGGILAPGGTSIAVADPSLKWESTKTYNAAIDLGLLQDKLYFTAEYFNRISSDLIVSLPIPASVGSIPATVFTNAATVKNSGIEFALTFKDNIGKFNYDITANANTLKNEVLKLGGTNNPIYGAGSKTEVGGEVGQLYGFVTEGIFQTAAEVKAHAIQDPVNTAPGDIKYKDTNGDGVINDNDRVYLGTAIPKIYYGLNLNGSYKNLDFSLFMQGSAGNKVFNAVYQSLMSAQYGNASVDELNFWAPGNTNTNVPRPFHGDPQQNNRFSDRFVESGTYLRLQNASIGYTIPQNVLKRSHAFNSLRVYLSAQNIFTLSSYRGYDPDFISDGLFSRGYDYGSFPNPRTIIVGVQVGL
jgi:TonB-linked SusC/RagA family outer membrane protein